MTTVESEVREALLEGMAVELIPEPAGTGWYARIGTLSWTVEGDSAAHVFLKLADLLSAPPVVGMGEQ